MLLLIMNWVSGCNLPNLLSFDCNILNNTIEVVECQSLSDRKTLDHKITLDALNSNAVARR